MKERDARGGKPAIIVSEEKFIVKELCPNEITVSIGVKDLSILSEIEICPTIKFIIS